MKYMLDTNILIYFLKRNPPHVAERVDSLPSDVLIYMSFITYAELLKGAERSTKKAESIQKLKALTQFIPVGYPQHDRICHAYAQQFYALKQAGTPIGGNDLWIACHALADDATLVTNNVKEFERIEGLKLENWV